MFRQTMCAVAALVLSVGAGVAGAADKPNILMILADDMGYGDLGSFGSVQIETPVLDQMAADGIRATDGYVAAAVCAPSRAGLLTGRYPQNFGFEHNLKGPDAKDIVPWYNGIPPNERTMANYLKDAGYRTGLIGKWHVGSSVKGQKPNERGFDTFFGMIRGHHDYFPTAEKNDLFRDEEPITEIPIPYLTDWFTQETIDFIKTEGEYADMDGDKPWFMFLSYTTPHTPMQAKDEDLARFEHIPHMGRRLYAAMQWNMDQNIGRIVEELKATGQLDNTLIVFFSDNGGSVNASNAFNGPMFGNKGTHLEGGLRVPYIFHWPAGGLTGGKVYENPFISLDLTPTFLAAAGAPVPARNNPDNKKPILDGVNLLPHLRGEIDGDPHEALFWRQSNRQTTIRKGKWKMQIMAHHPATLINLEEDVSERNNVIADHPEIEEELWVLLNDWQDNLEGTPKWFDGPFWFAQTRGLYDRPYQLEQPERDEAYNGTPEGVRTSAN